jgi:alkanesulfonate monooxygenase SsuD/methylene tetrahydromethanopterin reductase-like flavin-dependent oxidoreductase (luciferase family)
MVLKPFQKPHPPIWYGLAHERGAEWAATNGVHVLTNHPAEGATELFARYREVWQRKQGNAPMPKLGMTRHVVVAATDAEAEAIARTNYATWFANLTKLWRDFGSSPIRFARDFDEARQRGLAVAGTAAHVREELERQIAVSTCTYLVIRPIFGDVTEAQAAASTDRFASEVLPHLTALTPKS